MKQSVLIASPLGGGVALGAAGLFGYQALQHTAPAAASQPVAVVASAPQVASAPTAPVAAQTSAPVATQTARQPAAQTVPARPAVQHANYAKVLSVKPITEEVSGTRTECHAVQVQRQAPVQDENRITGTVIGGVLGGVLGHQVGNGRGKDVATAIGAVAGGLAGNKVQQNMQQKDTYADTENRCMEVPTTTHKVVAYQVRYSLDGQTGSVRMTHKPGKRIPARNGQLVLE